MQILKVNADYESELFTGVKSPVANEALEFLAFFLDERPVQSTKKYSKDYFDYIESIKGIRPQIASHGELVNWWGELKNIDREKWLNSKVSSAQLNQKEGWLNETYVVKSENDLSKIPAGNYLIKTAFGMSGQKFTVTSDLNSIKNRLAKEELIIEPFFDRKFDFSHYVFPDKKIICYENVIDSRFQYKGTIFENYQRPCLQNLSFFEHVTGQEWENFKQALSVVVDYFWKSDNKTGFSIDSFIYEKDRSLKIKYLSEINYRRTMGQVAYELSQRFANNHPWTMLFLHKSQKSRGGFTYMREKLSTLKNVIILSPGDTRFEMIFIFAKNRQDGLETRFKIEELLS